MEEMLLSTAACSEALHESADMRGEWTSPLLDAMLRQIMAIAQYRAVIGAHHIFILSLLCM